jgi:hypothetical protein
MRASVAEVGWARWDALMRDIREYRPSFSVPTISSRASNAPPPARLIEELQRYASELTQSQSCSSARPRGGVYGMWNPATNRFEYVGRTVDLDRRARENLNNSRFQGLDFRPIGYTDIRAEQRGLEESNMNLHGSQFPASRPTLNQIRGVSPSNPNRGIYEGAASAYEKDYSSE